MKTELTEVTATARAFPLQQPSLALVLRAESGGPAITLEAVRPDDLVDAATELWRERFLRQGSPQVPRADLQVEIIPILAGDHPNRCTGFVLRAAAPGGQPRELEFTNHSLESVATRAADRAREVGQLQRGQSYVYELVVHAAAPAPLAADDLAFEIAIKSSPLAWLQVPLRRLLEVSTPENMVEDDVFPVFYTAESRAQAEEYARKGAMLNARVETGAILVGPLCSCPQTGEFFCVVTDVFPVTDADQTTFSLGYTNRSWTRLEATLRARQSVQPAVRMLGQCHGHNFLPNDGKTCEACVRQPVCDLTNVFVSLDDRNWTRAVFSQQPWQLCHIFGLSARGDRINGLYSLQDARLRRRGFFVLPEFNFQDWPASTAIPT